MLIPRVALTSILSPAPLSAFVPGMQVYNTATAGTAPDNVTEGLYIAGTTSWSKQGFNLFGDRGDITITGNTLNPTLSIDNAVVNSPKLATSLKVGGGSPSSDSVALEVTGGSKGFVVSTTGNLNSILSPVVGMMVYSTTENCLRIYTNAGWSNCLLAATGTASTNGSGTTTAYAAAVDKTVTPVYGKKVASTLTTTSSATVNTVGSYNIIASSPTLPGLIFNSTGTFAATGAQTVTLTANGAIDTASAGTTHTFTSNTTPSFTFTLTVDPMTYATGNGSTFNAFYNGHVDAAYTGTTTTVVHTNGEVFSNNGTCTSKTISQTAPASCTGSVTGASGTDYPLVWINGQCWFNKNLYEVPSNYPDAPNTGNNIWLNTNKGINEGKWGYYNNATLDGSAGWATSEDIPNQGILYQWNAAMNNSVIERAQGACPTGFHIPSDCEVMFLEHGLGMSTSEQVLLNSFRSNVTAANQGAPGLKLRGSGPLFNNASGFSFLMVGARFPGNGSFSQRNLTGSLWTSSFVDSSLVISRYMQGNQHGVNRTTSSNGQGNSVRCLKD